MLCEAGTWASTFYQLLYDAYDCNAFAAWQKCPHINEDPAAHNVPWTHFSSKEQAQDNMTNHTKQH